MDVSPIADLSHAGVSSEGRMRLPATAAAFTCMGAEFCFCIVQLALFLHRFGRCSLCRRRHLAGIHEVLHRFAVAS